MEGTRGSAEQIGAKICEARGRQGMTQRQLAAGVAEATGLEPEAARRSLNNHESGRFAPRYSRLQLYATLLDHPLEFFWGEPEVSPDGEFRSAA